MAREGSAREHAVSTGVRPGTARERILDTAYELFSRHGVQAVGVDTIVTTSGVAKMTLYRHFPSKDELALAFLQRRAERWTQGWLQAEVAQRADTARDRLLVIFDLLDEWFHAEGFEGCPFIKIVVETQDPTDVLRTAAVEHLATIRSYLRDLAAEAGVPDPDEVAGALHVLMKGSIVAAEGGDTDAARRARGIADVLLASQLPGKRPPRGAAGLWARMLGRGPDVSS